MLVLPFAAGAQSIVSTGESFLSARLLPGMRYEDGSRMLGLRLTMAPGWKTYWRSPGEAGIPPQFDWSGSRNVADIQVMWPRPEVFQSFGYRTIGYSDRVVLPVHVTPRDSAAPMAVDLVADLGVCKEICVFEHVELSEEIAPDLRDIAASEIEYAMHDVPVPAAEAGLRAAACRITGNGAHRLLEAHLDFGTGLTAADVIVEGSETLWITGSRTRLAPDGIHVSAEIELPADVSWIERDDVRLTVLADTFTADIRGCRNHAG